MNWAHFPSAAKRCRDARGQRGSHERRARFRPRTASSTRRSGAASRFPPHCISSFLLAACLIAAWLAHLNSLVRAAEVTAGTGTGAPGTSATVPLSFTSDLPVTAAQFDLVYPAASVSSDGGILSDEAAGLISVSRAISPGKRRFVIYSAGSKPLPSGALVQLSFHIPAQAAAGLVKLSLENAILSDATGHRVSPATLNAGALTITSGPPPEEVRFTSALFDATGALQLQLSAPAGGLYALQRSLDLRTWTSFSTNSAPGGTARATDPSASGTPHRFYRAVLLP